jgi:hypothetical protein
MRSAIRALPYAGLVLLGLGAVAVAGGCGLPYGVPPFSQLAAEAPGTAASFQAPDEGTVWVVGPSRSGSDRHIVFSGLVRRGEWITVDPIQKRLMVDGKPAEVTIEGGSSHYEIWFKGVSRNILSP